MLGYSSLSVKSSKNELFSGGGVLVDILCFIADFCFEPFDDLVHNKNLQKIRNL